MREIYIYIYMNISHHQRREGDTYHVQRPLNIETYFFLKKSCRTFFQAKFNQRQRSALLKEVSPDLFFPWFFLGKNPSGCGK